MKKYVFKPGWSRTQLNYMHATSYFNRFEGGYLGCRIAWQIILCGESTLYPYYCDKKMKSRRLRGNIDLHYKQVALPGFSFFK